MVNTHLHNNSHLNHVFMYSSTGICLYFHSEHLIQKLRNLIKDYVPLPQNNIWLGILRGAYYCNKSCLNFTTLKITWKASWSVSSKNNEKLVLFFFYSCYQNCHTHSHDPYFGNKSVCIFHISVTHYPSALLLRFHLHSSLFSYVSHYIMQFHIFFTANTTRFHTWKIINICSFCVFITLLH